MEQDEQLGLPLHVAARTGDVDAMTQLLDGGAAVDQTRVDGEMPLHIACGNGHVDAARLLLDKGAEVDRANQNGTTPLYVACQQGHVDLARLLLDKGADVDQSRNGVTLLFLACQNGHVDVAKLLLERSAEVDGVIGDGTTPLHVACQNGHVDAMRLLLDNGAEVDRAFIAPHASASSYAPYATPLFIACQKGHVDAARLLLQRGAVFAHDSSALGVGDRVEARYRGGSYYSGNISRYCGEGRYDIAYDSDDGPWERGDGEGVEARLIRRLPLSALDIAKEHGHFAVVALLKEHQAAAATSGCATS